MGLFRTVYDGTHYRVSMGNIEDLENLFNKSCKIFNGKIDFVLHSIGMSLNVRKNRQYTDLNYDFLFEYS